MKGYKHHKRISKSFGAAITSHRLSISRYRSEERKYRSSAWYRAIWSDWKPAEIVDFIFPQKNEYIYNTRTSSEN
jgi:hypothetical protein